MDYHQKSSHTHRSENSTYWLDQMRLKAQQFDEFQISLVQRQPRVLLSFLPDCAGSRHRPDTSERMGNNIEGIMQAFEAIS